MIGLSEQISSLSLGSVAALAQALDQGSSPKPVAQKITSCFDSSVKGKGLGSHN